MVWMLSVSLLLLYLLLGGKLLAQVIGIAFLSSLVAIVTALVL